MMEWRAAAQASAKREHRRAGMSAANVGASKQINLDKKKQHNQQKKNRPNAWHTANGFVYWANLTQFVSAQRQMAAIEPLKRASIKLDESLSHPTIAPSDISCAFMRDGIKTWLWSRYFI